MFEWVDKALEPPISEEKWARMLLVLQEMEPRDADGRPYYWNAVAQSAQWERPVREVSEEYENVELEQAKQEAAAASEAWKYGDPESHLLKQAIAAEHVEKLSTSTGTKYTLDYLDRSARFSVWLGFQSRQGTPPPTCTVHSARLVRSATF